MLERRVCTKGRVINSSIMNGNREALIVVVINDS